MTDLGWRNADGMFYNLLAFPVLFKTIGYTYGRAGDGEFRVPNMMRGKVELGTPFVRLRSEQMPVHSHAPSRPNYLVNPSPHTHSHSVWWDNYPKPDRFDAGLMNHNHGYFVGMDPSSKPIGHVTHFRQDDRGLVVNMKFDSSDYSKKIRELIDKDFTSKIVSASEMRNSFGLQSDADLFPDITAPRGGLKFGTSSKENNMTGTTRLKTPSKNIKRKDLNVAMQLLGVSDQDELLDVIATVQELEDGQKIYRAYELQRAKLSDVTVKIDSEDVTGVLTDAQGNYIYDPVKLVVDGKMLNVPGSALVIVTPASLVGEDSLLLTKD